MARARIAVIDDDVSHIELLQEVLSDEGYEVVAHTDLHDAPVFVKEQRPVLVLLDLLQGHRPTGLDALCELKADRETRDVPVIVVSADALVLRDKAAELSRYGVVVTIEKPYSLEDLFAIIHDAVKR